MTFSLFQAHLPFHTVFKNLRIFRPQSDITPEDWSAREAASIKAGDLVFILEPIYSQFANPTQGIGVTEGDKFRVSQVLLTFRLDNECAMCLCVSSQTYDIQFAETLLSVRAELAAQDGKGFYYLIARPVKAPGSAELSSLAEMQKYGQQGNREDSARQLPEPAFGFLKAMGLPVENVFEKQPLDIEMFGFYLFAESDFVPPGKAPDLRSYFVPLKKSDLPSAAKSESQADSGSIVGLNALLSDDWSSDKMPVSPPVQKTAAKDQESDSPRGLANEIVGLVGGIKDIAESDGKSNKPANLQQPPPKPPQPVLPVKESAAPQNTSPAISSHANAVTPPPPVPLHGTQKDSNKQPEPASSGNPASQKLPAVTEGLAELFRNEGAPAAEKLGEYYSPASGTKVAAMLPTTNPFEDSLLEWPFDDIVIPAASEPEPAHQIQQQAEPVPQIQQEPEPAPPIQQQAEPVPQFLQLPEPVPQIQQQAEPVPQFLQQPESVPQIQQQAEPVPQFLQQPESVPQVQQQAEPVPQFLQQQAEPVPQVQQQAEPVPQFLQQQAEPVPQVQQQPESVPQIQQQAEPVPQFLQQQAEPVPQVQQQPESVPQVQQQPESVPQIQQPEPVPQFLQQLEPVPPLQPQAAPFPTQQNAPGAAAPFASNTSAPELLPGQAPASGGMNASAAGGATDIFAAAQPAPPQPFALPPAQIAALPTTETVGSGQPEVSAAANLLGRELPAAGVAGLIAKFEQQAQRATVRLEQRLMEAQDKLEKDGKLTLARLVVKEQSSQKNILSLKNVLARRLFAAGEEVKESMREATEANCGSIASASSNASQSISDLAGTLSQEVLVAFDELGASTSSLASNYVRDASQQQEQAAAQIHELVIALEHKLDEICKQHMKFMEGNYLLFEKRLQELNQHSASEIESSYERLLAELISHKEDCGNRLSILSEELVETLGESVSLIALNVQMYADAVGTSVLIPRVMSFRQAIGLNAQKLREKYKEEVEKSGNLKLSELRPVFASSRERLEAIIQDAQRLKTSIVVDEKSELEKSLAALAQTLEEAALRARSVAEICHQELAKIELSVSALSDPAAIETDPELVEIKRQVVSRLQDIGKQLQERVNENLRRQIATMEDKGRMLQEGLISSMESDAFSVRKSMESSILKLKQALDEASAKISAAQNQFLQ